MVFCVCQNLRLHRRVESVIGVTRVITLSAITLLDFPSSRQSGDATACSPDTRRHSETCRRLPWHSTGVLLDTTRWWRGRRSVLGQAWNSSWCVEQPSLHPSAEGRLVDFDLPLPSAAPSLSFTLARLEPIRSADKDWLL